MNKIIGSRDYTYTELVSSMRKICSRYEFIKTDIIGKSCAGRNIYAYTMGDVPQASLFAAAFHGSEHITANILLMFMEELAGAFFTNSAVAGINARLGLSDRSVIFVPLVNPDGCEISVLGEAACGQNRDSIRQLCMGNFKKWNSNLRGVDINHNFDAGWEELRLLERQHGILGPAPSRYGGSRPESEPETAALVSLCRSRNIHHVTALHSQGRVIYWNYADCQPPRARQMAEIMAASSGYALDVPIPIAAGGGFKDWFIKEFNRPGFTVEIGSGENPLPADTAYNLYREIQEMLMLCAVM